MSCSSAYFESFIQKKETTDFYGICDPGNGKLSFVRLCEQFFCRLLRGRYCGGGDGDHARVRGSGEISSPFVLSAGV